MSVAAWAATGVQYLLLDGRVAISGSDFSRRVQKLFDEGATSIYQSANRAVLWTFRPQHSLNLTFDDCLTLVGYDTDRDQPHGISLRLYWYTQQVSTATYVAFVHVINPTTRQLLGQADTALGGYPIPQMPGSRTNSSLKP